MGFGSDEGDLPGLGWIPGHVKKFNDETKIELRPNYHTWGGIQLNDIQNHRFI